MKTIKKLLFVLPILALFVFSSCNRDDDEGGGGSSNDVLVGTWNLKVLTNNNGSYDVSNADCYKNSKIVANSNTFKLDFIIQNQDTGECDAQTYQLEWVKENGTYYEVANGQKSELPIQFLDNNQTLQLNLSSGADTVILSFQK